MYMNKVRENIEYIDVKSENSTWYANSLSDAYKEANEELNNWINNCKHSKKYDSFYRRFETYTGTLDLDLDDEEDKEFYDNYKNNNIWIDDLQDVVDFDYDYYYEYMFIYFDGKFYIVDEPDDTISYDLRYKKDLSDEDILEIANEISEQELRSYFKL